MGNTAEESSRASEHRSRIILGGIAGNVMEWYDFALYGFFAAIIGKQFFPSEDPTVSTIAAFGAFAAGFLARPLGGILLGRLGDVLGRRQVLMISVLAMAVPTVMIGLLPSHEHIGMAAPILVVLLRIIQGLSVGGEYTSSAVFLAEHSPHDRRGLIASWSSWGATAGMLLGSAMGMLLTAVLDAEQLASWGWRIPFLSGALIAGVSVLLRRGLADDPPAKEGGAPVTEVFRDHLGSMGRIVGLNIGFGIAFYTIYVYTVTYMTEIDKLSEHVAFDVNTVNMVALLIAVPAAAWLSDRTGRKPLLLLSSAALTLGAVPLFSLIHSTDATTVLAGQLIFTVLIGLFAGPVCATNVEQLPRHVRCTGLAVAYNLSIGLFGGTTPMIAAWLIRESGSPLAPAYYLAAACAVSFLTALTLRETANRPLD